MQSNKEDEKSFTKGCSLPTSQNNAEFQETISMLKKELLSKHAALYAAEIIAHYIYIKDYEGAILQYEDINVTSDELDRMKLFIEIHLINMDRRTCTVTDGHLVANCMPYELNSFKCQRAKRTSYPRRKLRFGFKKEPRRHPRKYNKAITLLKPKNTGVSVEIDRAIQKQSVNDVAPGLNEEANSMCTADQALSTNTVGNNNTDQADDMCGSGDKTQAGLNATLRIDSKVIDLKRVFLDESIDLACRTKFIIRNKSYVHGLFNGLEAATQIKYLRTVISLTEDKLVNFLERKFDLEVFTFLGTYRAISRKFVDNDCTQRLKFMLNEEYYKDLGYNELWTMYAVLKDTKMLKYAVYKNPFADEAIVTKGFGEEMKNGGLEGTMERVCRVLEINWIKCLYEWALRHGMVNKVMCDTRACKKRAFCAVVSNDTKKNEKKLMVTKKTIW